VKEILYPVVALAALTFLVLLLIPAARFRAAARGQVKAADFRYGESSSVPGDVSLPNRNMMNLLELPMLFYIVCLAFYVTATVDARAVYLAWAYVALACAAQRDSSHLQQCVPSAERWRSVLHNQR